MGKNDDKLKNEENPVISVNIDKLNISDSDEDNIYTRKVKPYLDKIVQLKSQGNSDKEICKILDISTSTFYHLRKLYPDLQVAYETGIDMLIDEVEMASIKEAIGFEYVEEAAHPKLGVVELKKYARSNGTLAKHILNNHRPNKYANKKVVDTGKSTAIDITALRGLNPDDLKLLLLSLSKNSVVEQDDE